LLFEEFICREIEKGNITSDQFIDEEKKILLHGHCQQKAIVSTATTIKMLSLPKNYSVEEIPSGCCGMAGSFGYEKEHFGLIKTRSPTKINFSRSFSSIIKDIQHKFSANTIALIMKQYEIKNKPHYFKASQIISMG